MKLKFIFTRITSASVIAMISILLPLTVAKPSGNQHPQIVEVPEVDLNRAEPDPLPEGYAKYPGYNVAYKLHPEKLSWTDARDKCISEHAVMAVADTPDQIIRLKSIISPAVIRVNLGNTMLVHVGIHRPNGSKDWTRIDNGLPATSYPWTDDDSVEFNCASTSFDYMELMARHCKNDHLIFVCEISTTDILSIGMKHDEEDFLPPEGYVVFPEDDAAYKLHGDYVTWNEAQKICVSEGANLATPDSKEKINHVKRLQNELKGWLHVGFRRSLANDGSWFSIDNGLLDTRLDSSDDGDSDDMDCASTSYDSLDFLVKQNCDTFRTYFVCQIQIPKDHKNIPAEPLALAQSSQAVITAVLHHGILLLSTMLMLLVA